jgi:hypothetical protein
VRHFLALDGDDALQDVGHGACPQAGRKRLVTATN